MPGQKIKTPPSRNVCRRFFLPKKCKFLKFDDLALTVESIEFTPIAFYTKSIFSPYVLARFIVVKKNAAANTKS
jgi:hypothetical protein